MLVLTQWIPIQRHCFSQIARFFSLIFDHGLFIVTVISLKLFTIFVQCYPVSDHYPVEMLLEF